MLGCWYRLFFFSFSGFVFTIANLTNYLTQTKTEANVFSNYKTVKQQICPRNFSLFMRWWTWASELPLSLLHLLYFLILKEQVVASTVFAGCAFWTSLVVWAPSLGFPQLCIKLEGLERSYYSQILSHHQWVFYAHENLTKYPCNY